MLGGMFASPGQRALEGRLAALVAGQSVLAQEVANMNTPGYAGQDVASFQASLQAALTQQLGGSAPGRGGIVPAVPAVGGSAPLLLAATSSSPLQTPDGNGTNFNAMMVSVAENDLQYQAVSHQLQLGYQNLSEAIDASPGGMP